MFLLDSHHFRKIFQQNNKGFRTMKWSPADIEKKREEHAEGRASQLYKGEIGKIKVKDEFKDNANNFMSPGILQLSVDYTNGSLTVSLGNADIFGKRSQDPYALCYLLGNDGQCYFQKGNNKTKTFDKNIKPNFDKEFKFRMSLDDITEMRLVVAIWDEDSDTRDDFMAGLRMSLKSVQYFKNRSKFAVELQHQEKDGHPALMSDIAFLSDVEQKREINAEGRAFQHKIMNEDKYHGMLPGKQQISVEYSDGCLKVFLGHAENLYGKRSQDPYALCYLLSKDGRCYFQVGHNKTQTFQQNLNPPFEKEFKFRMSLIEINTMSLVVAIWDEDSTSRDDYMAGLKVSLKYVQYFQNKNKISVQLQHQGIDGHPALISDRDTFGIVPTFGSWDLKTCNNHLVKFIDGARVLAGAYEIQGSLPLTLQERSSLIPPDASRLFDEEILRLKTMVSIGRSKLAERRRKGDGLKTENSHLNAAFTKDQYAYKECQSTLNGLELKESELSAKVIGLDHLREEIRILKMRIATETQRINHDRNNCPEVGQIQVEALYIPSVGGINMGQSKYEQEKMEIEIRIRKKFENSMKILLEKARQSYKVKYKEFILKIEKEADEIMRLYEDIIQEKSLKSSDRKDMVLDLERSRAYQLRINQLLANIRDFDSKIGTLEGKLGGLDADYRNQLGHLDAKLDDLKKKLRNQFEDFTKFAGTRWSKTKEVSIYDNLLGLEEGRLTDTMHRVQMKGTVSESVVKTSRKANVSLGGAMSTNVGNNSGSDVYRRESGYSSCAHIPSSVRDGGIEVFDSQGTIGNGRQSSISKATTMSSRHSSSGNGDHGMTGMTGMTGMSMNSKESNIFDDIEREIL